MKDHRKGEQRCMDGGKVVGDPLWKEDVRDAAPFGPKAGGQPREGTSKPVGSKDQTLARNHRASDGRAAIRLPPEACVEQVDHARLDREPGEGVDSLDHR